MALIDALRSGVDLANASNQGVQTAAAAQYAFPMQQQDYLKAQLGNQYQGLVNQYYGSDVQSQINQRNATTQQIGIQNQYLPQELQLKNQYQGLVNQEYVPNIQSEINQRNTETQFTPLKYAIEAQNSIRNNSRFSNAAQYLRTISTMKQGDQQIYLSDPNNFAAYQSALAQMQGATNNPNFESVLTPSFLNRFFPGSGLGGSPQPSSQSASLPTTSIPDASTPGTSGLAASILPPGNNSLASQVNKVAPQLSGGLSAPIIPSLPNTSPVNNLQNGNQQSTNVSNVHPAVAQSVAQTIAANSPNTSLSPDEKMFLAHQSLVNQKEAGSPLWNRAQGAVVLEKWLQDNQADFAQRLASASQYAGALGQGQLFADKVAKDVPQSLIDYNWVKSDFIPNLGNQIKVMEKLSSTDGQRKALNQMQESAFNWYMNPEAAIKSLNMGFDMFSKQAKATLGAAQAVNPGVLEKLNGINTDSNPSYIGDTVPVKDKDGVVWNVPLKNLKEAVNRINKSKKGGG